MPRTPSDLVELPEQWWQTVRDWYSDNKVKTHRADTIFDYIGLSDKTVSKINKDHNRITEQSLRKLAGSLGFEDNIQLIKALRRGASARRALSEAPPGQCILKTKRNNFQAADFIDLQIPQGPPWTLRCEVRTESRYFRFGYKLLTDAAAVFGDASIQSNDSNLIVHIGRNNWDRPAFGITGDDIFFTAYRNGVLQEPDKFVCTKESCVSMSVEIGIQRTFIAVFSLDGTRIFQHPASAEIAKRVIMLAWGDQDEFTVEVDNIELIVE